MTTLTASNPRLFTSPWAAQTTVPAAAITQHSAVRLPIEMMLACTLSTGMLVASWAAWMHFVINGVCHA